MSFVGFTWIGSSRLSRILKGQYKQMGNTLQCNQWLSSPRQRQWGQCCVRGQQTPLRVVLSSDWFEVDDPPSNTYMLEVQVDGLSGQSIKTIKGAKCATRGPTFSCRFFVNLLWCHQQLEPLRSGSSIRKLRVRSAVGQQRTRMNVLLGYRYVRRLGSGQLGFGGLA